MLKTKYFKLMFFTLSGVSCIHSAYADNKQLQSKESEEATQLAEFEQYSGVLGTAPKDLTVTSTGFSIEQTPGGVQPYLFFTQTLANGIYYEGRVYGRFNLVNQNPVFPNIPQSSENPPFGYGFMGKFGYNFHASRRLDITPYLRLNDYYNMSIAYADTNGDYIDSNTLGILPGAKFTFKMTPDFTPYIDLYGGYQKVALVGQYNQGIRANQTVTANVDQIATVTEFGFAYKVSDYIAVIPYIQNLYVSNHPDSTAASSFEQGGFNVPTTTVMQQVFGIKFSVSWY